MNPTHREQRFQNAGRVQRSEILAPKVDTRRGRWKGLLLATEESPITYFSAISRQMQDVNDFSYIGLSQPVRRLGTQSFFGGSCSEDHHRRDAPSTSPSFFMAVAIRADQLAPPFVFATLKPSNPLAKLAFSHTFEQVSDVLQAYQRRMLVEPEQIYDKDILRLRLKRNPGFLPLQSDINDDVSESSTDPGSGTEQDWRGLGMVWTGCYPFDLGDPPDNRITGWTVGKGRDEINIDFLINTPLRRDQVRGYHALFNLHRDTGYLYIMSRASSTTSVTVNGHEIARGKMHALNQSPMTIRFGPLEYIFEYAETARSPAFYSRLQGYMKNHLGVTESDFSLTPTPTGQVRTVGDWTLGKSLGRGSYGKVYAATNSKNHIVAIKLVDRKSKKDAVNKEIETLKALTDLAEDKDDEGRLLRLRDVIYQNGKEDYSSTRFEDIILVLEPATPDCFDRLTTDATDRLGR